MKIQWSFIFFTIAIICFDQMGYAQKGIIRIGGSAQEELTRDQSQLEIENRVKDQAIINALEKAFGRVIIQGNSTYISNLETGQEVETNTIFNTIANTYVQGEVIEIINEEYTKVSSAKTVNGKSEPVLEIRCDIIIRARKVETLPINFKAFTLSCPDEKCKTTFFRIKDPFYIFFTSPISGYITVYLDDQTLCQCLYPHYNMTVGFDSGVPVEADKRYILFSDKPEHSYFPDKNLTPVTYEMFANSSFDMNRLFIIFSKKPLNKPFLKDVSEALLERKEYEDGYRLPKSLPSEDFQRWINSYRSYKRSDVQVSIIDITITK